MTEAQDLATRVYAQIEGHLPECNPSGEVWALVDTIIESFGYAPSSSQEGMNTVIDALKFIEECAKDRDKEMDGVFQQITDLEAKVEKQAIQLGEALAELMKAQRQLEVHA